MPIWGHLLLGVCTLGIYFLFLPLIILWEAAQAAWAKFVAAVITMVAKALYYTFRAPARALWRLVCRLLSPRTDATPPPPDRQP